MPNMSKYAFFTQALKIGPRLILLGLAQLETRRYSRTEFEALPINNTNDKDWER